jgi:hypothetical protein
MSVDACSPDGVSCITSSDCCFNDCLVSMSRLFAYSTPDLSRDIERHLRRGFVIYIDLSSRYPERMARSDSE